MRKKLFSLLLVVAMSFTLVPTAFAASNDAVAAANALYELGLFKGTGINADGTPNFDLDRAPTRNEAVTMLVRLLGKEDRATSGTWEIPFTDVADWAKPYVGCAYADGLTTGTSATTFGGDAVISASQYITFVLRALGYESGTDFRWDSAWELSDKIGLTSGQYGANTTGFTRGDVAFLSYSALAIVRKGTEAPLRDSIGVNTENNTETEIDANQLEGVWQWINSDNKIQQEMIFENGRWKLCVSTAAYHEGSYVDNGDTITLTREVLVNTNTNEVEAKDFSPKLSLVRNADGTLSYTDGLWTNVRLSKSDTAAKLPEMLQKVTPILEEYKATGITTLDASSYAYLATNDFRSIRNQYSNATAQCAYVYLYENLNGEHCVLVDVRYKIITNFSQLFLHNLDQSTLTTNPVDYYDNLANRSYGATKIQYMKLANEINGLHTQMLQAMKTVLEGGQNPWSGVYVDASTLNQ